MASYLESMRGQRLGGGECAHLATEALRVTGGQFIRTNSNTQDYVWSDNLVTKVSIQNGKVVYSNPSARLRPGDIIQYTDTKFSDGKSATHHTSVVAAVDSKGRVTEVYEQNVGKLLKGNGTHLRYVVRQDLNLSKLTSGHVKIYRPESRSTHAGRFEFTVVNNASSSQTYKIKLGSSQWSTTVDKVNTANSYRSQYYTTSGTAKPTITVGTTTLTVQDGASYEIYSSNGQISVRKASR
jgi:hypothetical protein